MRITGTKIRIASAVDVASGASPSGVAFALSRGGVASAMIGADVTVEPRAGLITRSASVTIFAFTRSREDRAFKRKSLVDCNANTTSDATTGKRTDFRTCQVAGGSSPPIFAPADTSSVETLIAVAVPAAFEVAWANRAAVFTPGARNDAEFAVAE